MAKRSSRLVWKRRAWLRLVLVTALAAATLLAWVASATAGPPTSRFAYAPAEVVPIPAAIPHEEGDMVDRRIVPNLRWLSQRFPIYVTDGYSGRLPGTAEHVGCRGCHVTGSDHHNGLAVDIVARSGSSQCDAGWRGITRLARWAEPRQNRPLAPFRWVGYDGDAGHGCGHHLHLSWEHATVRQWQLAEWVQVFAVSFQGVASRPQPRPDSRPPAPEPPPSPPGGISSVRAGGIGAGD
ncbi:MAG TPA: hypothetical protein VFY04_04360 [Solirubrobacterales bacterium]|nr:hypothetical protein [Solirubrobacterales bacterium]